LRQGAHAIAQRSPVKTTPVKRDMSRGVEYDQLLALACHDEDEAPPPATFSAYMKMKCEWRDNVYLARSKIQVGYGSGN